jgi:hypothetical protein
MDDLVNVPFNIRELQLEVDPSASGRHFLKQRAAGRRSSSPREGRGLDAGAGSSGNQS